MVIMLKGMDEIMVVVFGGIGWGMVCLVFIDFDVFYLKGWLFIFVEKFVLVLVYGGVIVMGIVVI